jgi:hypothetical protein
MAFDVFVTDEAFADLDSLAEFIRSQSSIEVSRRWVIDGGFEAISAELNLSGTVETPAGTNRQAKPPAPPWFMQLRCPSMTGPKPRLRNPPGIVNK